MINYKDKTFCSSKVLKHTCGREISPEELKQAESLGLYVCYGNFCKD